MQRCCSSRGFAPVYVIGGRQRADRSLRDLGEGWYGYAQGLILRVAPDGVDVVVEYESRPDACARGDPVLFKSASRVDDRLYCCTQTEIVVYALPTFDEIGYVSLPRFNDVHHVAPSPTGTLLVANSGLDTVVETNLDGDVLGEWNVLDEDTWALHDPDVDYRIGVDLKPHRGHPNYVFFLDGDAWATRFQFQDAIDVADPTRRIDIGGERVHDGVVRGDAVYFTTVDGYVVEVGADDLLVRRRWDLAARDDRHDTLGWCRGLSFDQDGCWVGFSRVRPTKLRQNVSWIRNLGAVTAPTRIAHYGFDDWTLDAEIDLEPYGLNAVFSVIEV